MLRHSRFVEVGTSHVFHHPKLVNLDWFDSRASPPDCHPACPPEEGPERPDFFFRAAFWRVGPRSGGIVPTSLPLGLLLSIDLSSSCFFPSSRLP